MLGSIRASCQFPFYCRLGKNACVNYQKAHGINTLIEIVLDFIEITIIGIGNLRGYVTLGNPIHIFGCDIKRPDNRIECLVDAFHYFSIFSLMLCGISSSCKLSINCGFSQHAGVGNKCPNCRNHFFHGNYDTVAILPLCIHLDCKIACGNLPGDIRHQVRFPSQLLLDGAVQNHSENY